MFGRENNIMNLPAMADFVAQSSNGVSFKFVNTSYYNPTSFEWNFGTGDTSFDKDVTYTFPKDGVFTVSLKVANEFGSGVEKKMIITVKGDGERLFKDNGEQFLFTQDVINAYGVYGAGLGVENL